MKYVYPLTLAAILALLLPVHTYGSNPFPINAQAPVARQESTRLSVKAGEVLEFTVQSLEAWLGMESGKLSGFTITSLPAAYEGALILYGVEVDPYQFISREELDGLCFVANETAVTAGLTIQTQGVESQKAHLEITVLEAVNLPPFLEGASFSTIKNAAVTGMLSPSDPEGDAVSIQVTRQPKKGKVSFTDLTFVYEPFQNKTGSDSFAVVAIDRFGNYSAETIVDIKIENNRSGFRFVDMAGNTSEYAAFKLHEKGIISGEKVGSSWFYHPSRQMTRGEFLVALLSAAGMDQDLRPTVNTKLPDDGNLPLWLKPYIKKAAEELIISSTQPFVYDEIPTRAEAVQMVSAAAKIEDVKDYDLKHIADIMDIPEWALPSYKDLAAYRMLDLYDGSAHPGKAIDNAYGADLLWQLYKHTHR